RRPCLPLSTGPRRVGSQEHQLRPDDRLPWGLPASGSLSGRAAAPCPRRLLGRRHALAGVCPAPLCPPRAGPPRHPPARGGGAAARNDLLHTDAFPTRPSCGWRILRLFVNVNASEPRIWATGDTFPTLLRRYGELVGLPLPGVQTWAERLGRRLLGLVRPEVRQ